MGEIKTEARTLMCQLTEEEYQNKSKELSRLIREKAALADAKAAEMRHYNEEIAKTELHIQDVLPLVETGKEERQVVCEIQYNAPERGTKTIIRTDNGDIWTEEMTDEEKADMFYNAVEESNEDEGGIPFPKTAKKAKAN